MKGLMKSFGAMTLVAALAMAAMPGVASATDASEEAKKAAERAVSATIAEVLSETISDSQAEAKKSATLFATPSLTNIEIKSDLFKADVDVIQIVTGVVAPINDTLYFNGSVSYSDIEVENIDADFYLIDAGLISVIANRENLTSWMNFGVNYGEFEVENMSMDFYGAKVGATVENKFANKLSLVTNANLSVSKANESGADEAWALDAGMKLKHNGEKVTSSFAVAYQHGFAPDSDGEDSKSVSVSPAVDYQVNENFSAGLAYTYSTLLNDYGINLDVDAHTVGANLRYNY